MSRYGPMTVAVAMFATVLLPCIASADGGCCIPPSYQCFIMTQEECAQWDGYWVGEGSTCDPNP